MQQMYKIIGHKYSNTQNVRTNQLRMYNEPVGVINGN